MPIAIPPLYICNFAFEVLIPRPINNLALYSNEIELVTFIFILEKYFLLAQMYMIVNYKKNRLLFQITKINYIISYC